MIEVITATLPERRALFADCAQSIAAQTLAPAAWHVGFDHDRQGPAKVLNGLAQRVQTEWLFRLDDDDLLQADHFEVIKPFLKNNTADIVYTWCAVEGRMARNRFAVPFDASRLQADNFIPSCAAIRTTLFHELGGYRHDDQLDTTRHEDWDFWLRALERGARFLCIPIATWTYRMGDWQHRSA